MTPEEASAALAKAKLAPGDIKERFDSTMATGLVVASEPASGEVLKPGTPVTLIVSKGPKPVVIPDVSGRTFDEVKAELTDLGLVVEKTKDYSRDVFEGLVISSDPPAGNEVPFGGTVTVLVSQGPPLVEVPYLIDMQREEAVAALEGLGLVPDVQEGLVTPLNRVYNQTPDAGTLVPEGSTVTISII
jgi:serine/threonine-protein kinase